MMCWLMGLVAIAAVVAVERQRRASARDEEQRRLTRSVELAKRRER